MTQVLSNIASYVKEKIANSELSSLNYVGVDNLLQNKKGKIESEYVPATGYSTHFKKGDILIGNIRPYFKKIWIAEYEGGCSSDVLCIRANPNISPEYLYAYLSQDSFFDYVMAAPKGTKMPRGDKDHVMRYPIVINQSSWDIGVFGYNMTKKMYLNNNIFKNLSKLASTLYDYWFVQFDFPNEEGKPYKTSGGKMIWNDLLKKEIPEGWEVCKISEILGEYPKTTSITTANYLNKGKFPIIDQSMNYICGFTNDQASVLNVDSAIVFGDHTNIAKFVNFPFARGADGTQIIVSNNKSIPNYLLYHHIINLPVIEPGYSRHYKFLKDQNVLKPDYKISEHFIDITKNLLKKQSKCIFENIGLTYFKEFLLPLLISGQVTIKN